MRLSRDTSGNVVLLFALALPVLLGFCALSFDVAVLRYNQSQLQLAADAGALAGVDNLLNQTTAKSIAQQVAQQNSPQSTPNITATSDVDVGTYNPSATPQFQVTSQSPNAVRVHASRDVQHGNAVPTWFTRAIGLSSLYPVRTLAIATAGTQYCNYVLDPSATGAVQLVGGVSVNSTCGLYVDSSSNSAISALGLFSMNISSTCIVGNALALGLGSITPPPNTGCTSRPDPLRALPEPSAATSCQSTPLVLGGSLSPGCYTGPMTIAGNVTLSPGLYQFQSAQLSLVGAATLQGDGVTLYLDKNSTFNMVGLSSIDLAAPSSGTYQGIAIFYSRSAIGSSMNLIGGTLLKLNGVVYAPATNLTLTGVALGSVNCGYLVVNRLIITGAGAINLNAFASNARRPNSLSSRAVLAD